MSRSAVSYGSIEVVSVRGMVPVRASAAEPSAAVWYVGRRCGGWEASPLGNPFRLERGQAAGSATRVFRSWLNGVMLRALACEPLQGADLAAWQEIACLAQLVERGHSLRLGCWCGAPGGVCADTCHGWAIRDAIYWLVRA